MTQIGANYENFKLFKSDVCFRYKDSKLARLFNGTTPIMLDKMKHYYFIDRDGKAFRHILNFLRYDDLILPSDYKELSILQQEAEYFELHVLIDKIKGYSAPNP